MSFSTNREQFSTDPRGEAQIRENWRRLKDVTAGFETRLSAAESSITVLESVDPILSATNANGSAIVIGQPFYITDNDEVDLAQANALGTSLVAGLVRDVSIASSGTGLIQRYGILAATTAQWDAVTGDTGGLTAGASYYLDPSTAGMLTTTPPSTATQFIVKIGVASSTVRLIIDVSPILGL